MLVSTETVFELRPHAQFYISIALPATCIGSHDITDLVSKKLNALSSDVREKIYAAYKNDLSQKSVRQRDFNVANKVYVIGRTCCNLPSGGILLKSLSACTNHGWT